MDRRNWPWKKKSSDKTTAEKAGAATESVGASLSSLASLEDQDKYKKANYVQISLDSYTRLSGLEDEVNTLNGQLKSFEDEVIDLQEKLSTAHSEIKAKESLVMQHAKVAEEAVSGWEKADAEALALKRQLESVTLQKLTAEERASHLDDALRECTRQIRSVKEESEQRLHDVILTKTIQWDKIKLELEGKIDELNQGLLRAASENTALSRSLQERSNLIQKIKEEKSQAEAEIEFLTSNIQSHEKEISALKYELHVVSKELDIRNEEKNMSLRSAEIANKQHLDGVKKIAKLEAECQRLRSLVRKKLPGPAALAQMKLEVENLGHEFTDSRMKRAAAQNPCPYVSPKPEISIDKWEQCQRENELLTSRLLAMEEETKVLKESLAARNSELQVSRNLCAKTLGKLKSLEAQVQMLNQQKSSPKSNLRIPSESPSSGNASYAPSVTSVSEDGFDEEGSSSESGVALSSNSFKLRTGRSIPESCKQITNSLEFMDDFLEIEKLAANGNDGAILVSNNSIDASKSKPEDKTDADASDGGDLLSKQQVDFEPGTDNQQLSKLQSRIYRIFESQKDGNDMVKVVEDITSAIQEMQGLQLHHSTCISEVTSADYTSQVAGETQDNQTSLSQGGEPRKSLEKTTKQNLELGVSDIHKFISSIVMEVMKLQDTCGNGLSESLEKFSASVDNFTFDETGLVDFIQQLSSILSEATALNFGFLGFKHHSLDNTASECIDKVTLLENKIDKSGSIPSERNCTYECDHGIHSCSNMEGLQGANNGPCVDVPSSKCLLKELEQLKLEREGMGLDLTRCMQDLENTKLELQRNEQLLLEMQSQLASSQNLHSLAETQLKCVTESYKSLEVRAQELEAEVKHLQERTDKLEIALSEAKRGHQEALARCNDLQDKMERIETCSNCSSSSDNSVPQSKQEREISAAAEKLAACQETIYLLGKQLQALQPQANVGNSQLSEKLKQSGSLEGKPNHALSEFPDTHHSDEFDPADVDNTSSTDDNPYPTSNALDTQPTLSFRSMVSSTHPDHALTKSSSFSSSSKVEQEKHPRGFGRFFSSKGRNGK